MSTFRCEAVLCGATFEHPDTHECDHTQGAVKGNCMLAEGAGWREIWVRAHSLSPRSKHIGRDWHLFSRGGWICPECAARYDKQRDEDEKDAMRKKDIRT